MTVHCLGGIGPVKSFIAPTYWLKSEIDVKLAVLLSVIIFPLYRPLVWEKSYSTVSTNFEIFIFFTPQKNRVVAGQTCDAREKILQVFVSTDSLERRNLRKFMRAVQKLFHE